MEDNDPVDGRTCGWVLVIYAALTIIGVGCVIMLSMAIVGALVARVKAGDGDRWMCDAIGDVSVYDGVSILPYTGGEEEFKGLAYGLESVPFLLPASENRRSNYRLDFSQETQTLYIWPLPDDATDEGGGVHTACMLIAVHFDGVP